MQIMQIKNFAVWGNPIKQSLSPQIHQQFANQLAISLNYSANLGDLDNFEQQIIDFFQQKNTIGANVTAPFKERAYKLAQNHSITAKLAQAANTLYFNNNEIFADNTDGKGLVYALDRLALIKQNAKVLIIGAGGAVSGVLYELLQQNLDIYILNRTMNKALDLADRFAQFGEIKALNTTDLYNFSFDIIINATSLGLTGKVFSLSDEIWQKWVKEGCYFYDMQYNKQQLTPFLQYAKNFNSDKLSDGFSMLVAQAAYSFYLWHKKMPDIETVIRKK